MSQEKSTGLRPIQVAESKWPHLVKPLKMLETGHHKRGLNHYIMAAPALMAWAAAEGEEKADAEAVVMEVFLYGAVIETGSMEEEQRQAVGKAAEEWSAKHPALKSMCVCVSVQVVVLLLLVVMVVVIVVLVVVVDEKEEGARFN